ncbi:MAG: DUF4423 domain-containing protein, partial [Pseudomonadota bacterium]
AHTLVSMRAFEEWGFWKLLGASTLIRVAEAVGRLFASGCLSRDDQGQWIKDDKHMRFPNSKASPLFRNFHRKTMVHTIERFQERNTEEDFEKRLLSGMFVAGNPENFQKVRQILNEAIFKASEVLAEGEPTDLYHIGIQAVPWSDS